MHRKSIRKYHQYNFTAEDKTGESELTIYVDHKVKYLFNNSNLSNYIAKYQGVLC